MTLSISTSSVPIPVKVAVVGEVAVGKTSIVQRFTSNSFSPHVSTTAAAYSNRTVKVGESAYQLQLWDTAGQERFRSLSAMYYREAPAVVCVFDVQNPETLRQLEAYWIPEVRRGSPNCVCAICGNKCDLPRRVVSTRAGEEAAQRAGTLYFECSAFSGEGVGDMFCELARQAVARGLTRQDAQLIEFAAEPKKTQCC